MLSILTRCAALVIATLCFYGAWTEPLNRQSFIVIGLLFTILFVGAFFADRYWMFPAGAFAVGYAAFGIVIGKISLGPLSAVHYVSTDPVGFWSVIAGLIVVGLYTMWEGYKDRKMTVPPNSALESGRAKDQRAAQRER